MLKKMSGCLAICLLMVGLFAGIANAQTDPPRDFYECKMVGYYMSVTGSLQIPESAWQKELVPVGKFSCVGADTGFVLEDVHDVNLDRYEYPFSWTESSGGLAGTVNARGVFTTKTISGGDKSSTVTGTLVRNGHTWTASKTFTVLDNGGVSSAVFDHFDTLVPPASEEDKTSGILARKAYTTGLMKSVSSSTTWSTSDPLVISLSGNNMVTADIPTGVRWDTATITGVWTDPTSGQTYTNNQVVKNLNVKDISGQGWWAEIYTAPHWVGTELHMDCKSDPGVPCEVDWEYVGTDLCKQPKKLRIAYTQTTSNGTTNLHVIVAGRAFGPGGWDDIKYDVVVADIANYQSGDDIDLYFPTTWTDGIYNLQILPSNYNNNIVINSVSALYY